MFDTVTILNMKAYSSISNRLLKWDLAKLTKRFVIVGIIAAMVGSYLWYNQLYLTNNRRFWMAIENSMSLPSVTRTIENGGSGNQVVQQLQLLFSPQMTSQNRVTFNQQGATEQTAVVTEGVSYLDAQYSRYTAFSTNQKDQQGNILNLDPLLGKWEGSIAPDQDKEQARLTYLSELITLVIFGNFDSKFKNETIGALQEKGVYSIDASGVTEENIDGDTIIVFPVNVKLKPYVELLNTSFEHAGYGNFPQLDPTNYLDDAEIPVAIKVNKRTQSVVGVSFGSREEKYSGHGIIKTINRPDAEFSTGELEAAVQERLQGEL